VAVQGDKVMYGISAVDADAINKRNPFVGTGGRLPVAGDQLPAFVTKDYGGSPQVCDLHVLLNGADSWWVRTVPNGTTGQQGRWW
jgi:hypothetical protein